MMLRRILSFAILIGFLVWVGWYVQGNGAAFAPLLEVTWLDGAHLVIAFIAIMLGNGVFIAIVSSALGVRLVSSEYMSLSFASSFANYFLPFRGGTGIRAMYMNHVHGFPISEFFSTLSIMYVLHSVINGSLALLAMGIIAIKGGPANLALAAFFGLIVAVGVAVMFVDVKIDPGHRRFPLKQLAGLSQSWLVLRSNRQLMLKLWILIFAMSLATVWQCRAAFDAISVPLPMEEIVIYAASKNLATLIGLTPGAMGIVELVSIYLGSVLGYTTADALSVQGLIRAVAIGVLLLVGPVALLHLRRRLSTRDA